MKVMVVSYLLDPQLGGGAATSALRLCQGLVEQGIDVIAVSTQPQRQARATEADGFRVYYFRPLNLYWVADKDRQPMPKKVVWQLLDTWNPHVYRHLRRIIRRERPDVIHVHKMRGLSPAVWTAAAAENCRPIVQTCRDYEIISPEGLLETTVGRMALQRHWALRPYQAARAAWSREVDVVTAPSQFTLDTITGLGFFGNAHQLVVPNTHGYRATELPRVAPGLAAKAANGIFRFLYLGRLETAKGIDLLLRAFAGIAAKIPYARLDIAGDGTRAAALGHEYGALAQVQFHSHIVGQEKDNLIAQADVVVMPSIVREVFGNSIIEAFAFGKPVLAGNIGGMPELVQPGCTGMLFNAGDVESLSGALYALASASESVRAMGPACVAAAQDYTLEAVTTAYLKAYEIGRQHSARVAR